MKFWQQRHSPGPDVLNSQHFKADEGERHALHERCLVGDRPDVRVLSGRRCAIRRRRRRGRTLRAVAAVSAAAAAIVGKGYAEAFHSFSLRERPHRANGAFANDVFLVGPVALPGQAPASPSIDQYAIVRSKPADLVDSCYTASGERIVEQLTPTGGKCNKLYRTFMSPAWGQADRPATMCSLQRSHAMRVRGHAELLQQATEPLTRHNRLITLREPRMRTS